MYERFQPQKSQPLLKWKQVFSKKLDNANYQKNNNTINLKK